MQVALWKGAEKLHDSTVWPPDGALSGDFYQFNMMQAHFKRGTHNKKVAFDVYFRKLPCGSGYAIFAGLEQVLDFLEQIRFTEASLSFLRSLNTYEEDFLTYLANLRFRGDVYAFPEGEIVFAEEPLLRVEATINEAHWVETALLSIINHQTLIATKTARIVHAALSDPVLEFGLRRAHGLEAGLYGTRAAYIAGVESTSNVQAARRFGIPLSGTHGHAFVQSYGSEVEAFEAFVASFPDSAILLVDTYDVLTSGLPHAIQVFERLTKRLGRKPKRYGIRLDSGDLAYLSKIARAELDAHGMHDAIIVASGDLNEDLIRDLKIQGAAINAWGVGTELITAQGCGALGAVYKMVAEKETGKGWQPRLKVSENPAKITTPHIKQVVRFFDREKMEALADVVMLADEPLPEGPYEIFHPIYTMKRKTLKDYHAVPMLHPVMRDGRRKIAEKTVAKIRAQANASLLHFPPEILRLTNPHEYAVDLSQKLWDLKQAMVLKYRSGLA